MKFRKVQFVYIDIKYLEYMNNVDSEIFFDKNSEEYKLKPHLGILLNNDGKEYVIPLTSAKEKHMTWKDVTGDWYRIYEIIDTRTVHTSSTDIVVDIKNQDILKNIVQEEQIHYKQRLISVLDIRKMFPVKKGVYTEIQFNLGNNVSKEEKQRNALMLKEYLFLDNRKDKIEEKATKIYDKQISKRKVLPYCCDFKKLENACDEYEVQYGIMEETMKRENHWMMSLAKILFNINSETVSEELESRIEETDILDKLLNMVDIGKINEVENELYDLLNQGTSNCIETAILFYSYLNDKADEFLKENDYSREDVKEGIEGIAERVGLSDLINTLFIG